MFLGQYNGHSYFRNPSDLTWEQAKTAAENAGGYLSSHQTADENSTVASFNFFRGWIGLYQDLDDLISAVRKGNDKIVNFDTSCFDGKYITDGISKDYLDK